MALEVALGEVIGQGISAHVLGVDVADVDGAALLLLARVVVGKIGVLRGRARVMAIQPLLSLKRSIGRTVIV